MTEPTRTENSQAPVDSDAPLTEEWRIVYLGFRFYPARNERYHAYRRIVFETRDDLQQPQLGRELLFKKELLKASPGSILTVQAVQTMTDGRPDGSYALRTQGRVYTGENWRDVSKEAADEVNIWFALDRAQVRHAAASSASKIDGFEANLKPLRTAYLQLTAPARAILLAQVVAYIGGRS